MRPDNKTVIGVGGYAGVGKDTFAKFLAEAIEELTVLTVEIFGMSDPLRDATMALNPVITLEPVPLKFNAVIGASIKKGLSLDEAYTEAKANYRELREFLQRLGTEFGRNMISNDVWVNILKDKIKASEADIVIVTGIRFPNEVEFINSYLYHDLFYVKNVKASKLLSTHSSETSVTEEDFEVIVDNSGTLEQLKQLAKEIIRTPKEDLR